MQSADAVSKKMVKKESAANFSMPDGSSGSRPQRNAPPGFQPQPLNTCTAAAAAAAESPRNRDPSSRENGFGGLMGQSPNSSGQKPPRRTSRKRSRPQYYVPPPTRRPPDGPRRRGRPPKARSMSQCSIETRNGDRVSSMPLRTPREHMSACFIRTLDATKDQLSTHAYNQIGEQGQGFQNTTSPSPIIEQNRASASTFNTHDNEETLFDISLTEVPGPVSGFERVGNVDLKILQQVANALNYTSANQIAVDDTEIKSRSSDIDKNLTDTLKAINEKYGDITQDCSLESDYMKTLVLIGICKVVQDLQKKQVKDLDINTLDSYFTAVRDEENMKVNVRWLHNRLDAIKDTVRLSDEAKELVDERNRRLENIDNKNKEISLRRVEIERLQSEIRGFEDRLVQEAVLVEELNKKISAQTSEFSQLQHMFVLDGLI